MAADPTLWEEDPTALPYPDGSTLVVYWQENMGNSYQIIDRYGNLVFSTPQQLIVGAAQPEYAPQVIPDGSGGAFCVWSRTTNGPAPGFYAQRLDSLGNRLWGDTGVRMTTWWSTPSLDISIDGQGGLYVTTYAINGSYWADIWAQRLDSLGQPLWGDTGSIVLSYPDDQWDPQITYRSDGGAYIVWQDSRNGGSYGDLYYQGFTSWGSQIFINGGILIYDWDPWLYDVIPDGEGGFILHCGTGNYNFAFGVNSGGAVLWRRVPVSWWPWASIIEGEPGFFYLGYEDQNFTGIFAQRMDIQGNTYWPTFGSRTGALVMTMNWGSGDYYFSYQSPYLYCIGAFFRQGNGHPETLHAQVMDVMGNRRFGERGALMTLSPVRGMFYGNCAPDGEGGVVAVWEELAWGVVHNIYAKHINADGSLGGPMPLVTRPLSSGLQIQGATLDGLTYTLPQAGEITLDLFDLLGRRVATLAQGYQSAGSYTARYDHLSLPSGIYLLRLAAGGEVAVGKVAIIK